MDNATSPAKTLEDLNEEHLEKLIAPIVYLVILLIAGVPGNFFVLLIYGRKYSKCVYRSIITNLAIVDLTFCTLGIPFNIARIVHYYTFKGSWICKLGSSSLLFGILYDTHLMILLSVHRFRQVCRPLKRQITLHNVKYLLIACFVISLILALPQVHLEEMEYPVLEYNLTGSTCPITSSDPSLFWIINGIFHIFLFASYTAVLVIIYIMIGKKAYIQRNISITRHGTSEEHTQRSNFENKMTKIAFTISVVFAVSYISLFALKVAKEMFTEDNLNAFEYALLRIAERLYMVNHVANPFVYAFFDNRFRQPLKSLLSSSRSHTKDEYSTSALHEHTLRDHTSDELEIT